MADFYDILIDQIKKDDFYTILGCDELATTDQINAEFRQKAKKLHPDKNPDDEATAKLFERLQRARNILCDEEQRKKYDYWRRSGVAVPYEQWRELSRAVHTSMHWAVKPRKELMLRSYQKDDAGPLLYKENEILDEAQNIKRSRPLDYANKGNKCTVLEDDHFNKIMDRRRRWQSRRGAKIRKFRNYQI